MKKILIALGLILTFSIQAQVDRSQPKPGPAPKVNIGKPKSFKLSNGLTVLVVENHKLPRVTASLTIDNAPYAEGSKAGLADLTGSLMGSGTSKISKDDYNEEIEFYGANVSLHSGGGYASSLSKYFPRVLELMAQGVIDPLFTQEEFDKEKDKYIEGLKAGEKNVPAVASRVSSVLAYGKNHPNGEFVTEQTIKNVSLADVKKQYANFFSPNNAYLIIMGDIKFNEAKKLAEKHFGTWKKGNSPKIEYTDPKDVQYTQINFVDMPNAVQSEISLINMNKLRMTDKDYFAVILANQILGGDFNSYLNMNLREAHGWTYGARSSIGATRYISTFRASSSVRNSVTDSAVVEFLKEIKRIRTEKVDQTTLANVKAGYIGNFVMQIEKPQTVARYALNTILYELPDNFYENYIANINAVTVDDIYRVANKYFAYDNMRIVVTGKGSEVIEPLEKLGIPMFYFDKYGNPTDKPQAKAVDPSITPKVVLDKYIKAIGGETAVKGVNSYFLTANAEVPGYGTLNLIMKKQGGKLFQDVLMAGNSMGKTVFNGSEMNAGGKKEKLEAEELENTKIEAAVFPELELLKTSGAIVETIEAIDGNDTYVIKNGDTRFYYDVNTGLKVAESKEFEQMGQKMSMFTYYKNYKDVKGVKYAHSIIQNVGVELEFKATEIKINEGVSDADFK
ncbi:MAG: M16 family metallopeptidase [Flavobacteriaceae bacterium]